MNEGALMLETIRRLITDVVQPAHFFVAPAKALEWQHVAAEWIPWEIYRGRLLDRSQTRASRSFEAWNVFIIDAQSRSGEPLLSVLLDVAAGQLHVTRAVHCYAWEGYHAGDNVYLSREVAKWLRELVGTVNLAEFGDPQPLHDEVAYLLFRAVVGLSRLPLTSVEAPLPGFSLGELGYFGRSHDGAPERRPAPMNSSHDLVRCGLHGDLGWLEKAKLLELLLRSTAKDDLGDAAERFMARWREIGHSVQEFVALLHTLFDEVALSPYTEFVEKTLVFLHLLADKQHLTYDALVDFLSYLLRHLARHLTAYDLVTFHHRGANYPDALFLDAILKDYLRLAERQPALFTSASSERDEPRARIRRRALRQGWMMRFLLEGLPVPDLPTSSGENARILPPPHVRVSEEQIVQPEKRTRRLYANDPLSPYLGTHGPQLLRQSIEDLRYPCELRELGMALFLDRPFSLGKAPGQPDQTPLLSYEAFSRSIAGRRLQLLASLPDLAVDPRAIAGYQEALQTLPVDGVSLDSHQGISRPGAVSVEDARAVAEDFVFLRTTGKSVAGFLSLFDFSLLSQRFSLDYLSPSKRVLILRGGAGAGQTEGVLVVYDAELRRRLQLQVDPREGYATRAAREYPVAGLRVLAVWGPVAGAEALPEERLEAEANVIIPAQAARVEAGGQRGGCGSPCRPPSAAGVGPAGEKGLRVLG
jgi:hypothetical protein